MTMLYTLTLIFGLSFAGLHILAEKWSLYWHYTWLDMPMHVLGGVVVVLVLASLRQMCPALQRISHSMMTVLFVVILLGWEGLGIYRHGGLKVDFWEDTILDLICGTIGIILGYVLVVSVERLQKLSIK